ncbi:CD2 antigen cytoplasmic tail-binding protein 2 homolog [Prorops nasuta]|uniref:CD2 antigen cytoplasmic tail-binding protein 2 homolog n=1 Tax=Prorops nasuta TaxID=863751 RepID=UPI0034CD970F
MFKRKFSEIEDVVERPALKNSLDSDEEDDEKNEEAYNVINEDEIEGIEDDPVAPEANIGFTAFNMKEELEEGHFDKDGHYLWNKEKQIRDNWLDNIDWVQIKPSTTNVKQKDEGSESKGLAESGSDSDEGPDIMFDPTQLYRKILEFLQPTETVSKALCRLGKGKKRMTNAERWKKKKQAQSTDSAEDNDTNSHKIVKLTELANDLLTRTGNMDIYQETYEQIKRKVERGEKSSHPLKQEAELDMYADDFDVKEKSKFNKTNISTEQKSEEEEEIKNNETEEDEVMWELKWSQDDGAEIHGPHTTQQMLTWAKEGYFKSGAWVRRFGKQSQFYSAARMDFDLYL